MLPPLLLALPFRLQKRWAKTPWKEQWTLYADDTFLVGRHSRELNKILWTIEKHSSRYSMRLNKGKCVYINMGNKNTIKFQNGEELKKVEEADYLGAKITKKNLNRREVEERISKALEVCKKLKTFLKKTRCRFAWKLQVYNAVIVSKLIYGLETMWLNESLTKRLDAFQM